MNPFRRIRRKLRDIEYHSARSVRNPWRRAMGWNLGLSLLAGIACALDADRLIERSTELDCLRGRLFVGDGGRLDGYCFNPTGAAPSGWGQAKPYAEFVVTIGTSAWGWPSASRERAVTAAIELDRFDGVTPPTESDFAAVRSVLGRTTRGPWTEHRAIVLAAYDAARVDTAPPTLRVGHLLFNALVYWPIVYAVFSAAIGLTWVIVSLDALRRKASRKALRSRGLCPKCRHRVDGNLWSARCPECGEPLY